MPLRNELLDRKAQNLYAAIMRDVSAPDIPGVYFFHALREAGWSKSAIRHRIQSGRWVTLTRGMYFDPTETTPDSLLRAAVAIAGPGAVISHETAARLHRFDSTAGWPTDIVVSKPPGTQPPTIKLQGQTIRFVRRTADLDVTTISGIPVTSRAQTMIDVSAKLGSAELERVAESFLRGEDPKRPHDWREADYHLALSLIAQQPHVAGATTLRKFLLARGPVIPTGSIAETAGLQTVRVIPGIGPLIRQAEIRLLDEDGRRTYFLDFLASDVMFDFEIDGGAHLTKEQQASDLRRDRKLGRVCTVLRFSAAEALFHPEVLVKTVETELAKLQNEKSRGMQRHWGWQLTGSAPHWEMQKCA